MNISVIMARIFTSILVVFAIVESWYGLTSFSINSDQLPSDYRSATYDGGIMNGEYLISGTDLQQILQGPDIPTVKQGSASVKLLDNSSFNISFNLTTDEDGATLSIPRLAYPYIIAIDDAGHYFSICADDNNCVQLKIPAHYSGTIKVSFVPPVIWRVGEIISSLSAVIMFIYCLLSTKHKFWYHDNPHDMSLGQYSSFKI